MAGTPEFICKIKLRLKMVIMCITLSLAPEVLNYDPVTCAADMWYVLYNIVS